MEIAPATPSPTPEPSVTDVLRVPDLLPSVDVDKLLTTLPSNLPAEAADLAEKTALTILFKSQGVRVERFIAACLDWGVWATKLEVRNVPDLGEHSFSDEQDSAARELQAQFREFQFTVAPIPNGRKFEELNQTNHSVCYALGRILASVAAREPKVWATVLEWTKRAQTADFVSLESATGEPVLSLALAAMQPLFRGFAHELPVQLKSIPRNAPKFVEGLTELAKLYSADSARANPICGDAKHALSHIAALEPSLFDTEMSSMLNAPRRKQLLAGVESPMRRVELIQTFVESRFGLPIGAFNWEEMPLSRGPVIGAVEEVYRGLKAELREMLAAEGKHDPNGDFSFNPQTAFGALYEMFERHNLLDRIHGFRAIGVPTPDIIKEVLPSLRNENALARSEKYRDAVLLEDDEAALEQFDVLQLDEMHILDRQFIEPLLSTLLERGKKVSDSGLIDELEAHARLGGEFFETALKLLHLSSPERAEQVNASALEKAAALPRPHALPDLLDRCSYLQHVINTDSPQALLEACLPVAARLDRRFVHNDPSNYLVAVGPALHRPELWAARLRLDEEEGLEKLLRAAIVGSIVVGDEEVTDPVQRIAATKRKLVQDIALQTVEHVAKLLPETEFRTLFRATWSRLSDERRDSFIGAMTNSKFEMAWLPSMRSRVILAEIGSEASTSAISQRLERIRAFHANWTVQQYYR